MTSAEKASAASPPAGAEAEEEIGRQRCGGGRLQLGDGVGRPTTAS